MYNHLCISTDCGNKMKTKKDFGKRKLRSVRWECVRQSRIMYDDMFDFHQKDAFS